MMPDEQTPELVVFTDPEAQTRINHRFAKSLIGEKIDRLKEIAADSAFEFAPAFGSEEKLHRQSLALGGMNRVRGRRVARMGSSYKVKGDESNLQEIQQELLYLPGIDGAYIDRGIAPDFFDDPSPGTVTPDLTSYQTVYKGPSPEGLNTTYANTLPGGKGLNVKVLVYENSFNINHEDLINVATLYPGSTQGATTDPTWNGHGPASAGLFGAEDNGLGMTGCCTDAGFYLYAMTSTGNGDYYNKIKLAGDFLSAGDIVSISYLSFVCPPTTRTAPIIWGPLGYLAAKYITDRNVLIFFSAGNESDSLDGTIFDTPLEGFPSWWRNPLRRLELDSGAILIGAGAPPPGTNGVNNGPDRSKLSFSNYGSVVDAQGWGREVSTLGYGAISTGGTSDQVYTNKYSGTSSACPMVASAMTCLQGILKEEGEAPLSPLQMRYLLRNYGAVQQITSGIAIQERRIGNRPNLEEMIPAALAGEMNELSTGSMEVVLPLISSDLLGFQGDILGEIDSSVNILEFIGLEAGIFPEATINGVVQNLIPNFSGIVFSESNTGIIESMAEPLSFYAETAIDTPFSIRAKAARLFLLASFVSLPPPSVGQFYKTLPLLISDLTGVGLPVITGTMNNTLPNISGDLEGAVTALIIEGSFQKTLPVLSGDIEGTVSGAPSVITGSFAKTLPVISGDLEGLVPVTGSFAKTLPVISGDLEGIYDYSLAILLGLI